ncbi:MAG: type II toxin-antitoxin system VapC family toxin [Deltaproteobacteria bacterium]|nr:type II toxin-antitoxin system VapC family toxin [Deltaproteobacteria bacterium]
MKLLLDTHGGYSELAVSAEHVLAIESLPPIHKDPFDRLLIAQAQTEGMLLLTVDASVSQYKETVLTV